MKEKYKLAISIIAFVLVFLFTQKAEAHIPVIVPAGQMQIVVDNPEVSKAYYANLVSNQQYIIKSDKTFNLYLNLLVPANATNTERYSAIVVRVGGPKGFEEVARLNGAMTTWKAFFEPYGHDWYLKGPELKQEMPAGTYNIAVFGVWGKEEGRYVLAVGEKEEFTAWTGITAIPKILWLKVKFFRTNPFTFMLSPIGFGAFIVFVILILIVWLIIRKVKKYLKK